MRSDDLYILKEIRNSTNDQILYLSKKLFLKASRIFLSIRYLQRYYYSKKCIVDFKKLDCKVKFLFIFDCSSTQIAKRILKRSKIINNFYELQNKIFLAEIIYNNEEEYEKLMKLFEKYNLNALSYSLKKYLAREEYKL